MLVASQIFILTTVAITFSAINNFNSQIIQFTVTAANLPTSSLAEIVMIDDCPKDERLCPYDHVRHQDMGPTMKTIATNFVKLDGIRKHPSLPKVISHEPKKEIAVTEEVLRGYMRELLDIFDSIGTEPLRWRRTLRQISQKLSDCEKIDGNCSMPGMTLTEFADEIKKAVMFLKLNYRVLRAELYETDRASAMRVFEQQLLQIHHDMSVAVHLDKRAGILEQKWRTYFLVNLAQERFAPLRLEDHEVFGIFCQIYSLAHNKYGRESSPKNGQPEIEVPCSKESSDSLVKFGHWTS